MTPHRKTEMKSVDEIQRICAKYGCEPHQARDYKILERNKKDRKKLCKRCGGTGNELYSMFRKCQDCNGTGIRWP